jgi:tRNA threonylcarbamoyladenosine biosynthesis protein TsaB
MSNYLILGIETSGILCSVAWWQNGSVLLEYNLERKNEHAILLAAFVERGFKELEIDSKAVTHVAIGSGPGSFTGLRIGMSYAKGFCLGHNIPLIPVTHFELLSDLAEDNKFPVYTLIEAGKGNYYTGIFNRDKSELDEKYLFPISQLENKIPEKGQIVVHEENSKGYFTQFFGRTAEIIAGQYSAARLCALGYNKHLKGPLLKLNEIEPQYLQTFAGVL